MDAIFKKVEKFTDPSTILFRSIELKLLKKTLKTYAYGKSKIVDLGCGEGIVASIVFTRQLDYGLDNNQHALNQAKKRGTYKHILLTDARTIPLPDKSVDLVFSNSVLEHIPHLHEVIKEVSRILKPNGLFIFTTISNQFTDFTIFQIPFIEKWWGKVRNKKFQHYHTYSLTHWVKLLLLYDFSYQEGYYYISPLDLRFWELLLFLFYIPLRVSRELSRVLYTFLRPRINKHYRQAMRHGEIGAAICIVARKSV